MPNIFFPFSEYWWLYGSFTLLVLVLVALDLGLLHQRESTPTQKGAALYSALWVFCATIFGIVLYYFTLHELSTNVRFQGIPGLVPELQAKRFALQYLTGYLVEQSLSVDNIFIFVVIFKYFGIELRYQRRILFWGILGAIFFRAIFIGLGAFFMQFELVHMIFGALLVLTGIKMSFAPDKEIHPEKNPLVKLLKKFFPVYPKIESKHFFVRLNKQLHITPLLIALVFLEVTDLLFAIDSVPAIFAITPEPLIVFTSNIFAILGLRSLYFMLVGALEKFHILKYGL